MLSGNDNYGKPKSDYSVRLAAMDEKTLFEQTRKMIWLSSYAGNNPRSDFHWQCDACYQEARMRGKLDLYTKAYNAVKEELGY